MALIPETKISILQAISKDSNSVRWTEFFRAYEQPMRGFLFSRFPSVDQDDAIQETMMALMKALPDYHYTPDEKGHFRNYLMGILHNKACDLLRKATRFSDLRTAIRNEPRQSPEDNTDDTSWQTTILEAAAEQLMADEKYSPATREIFRHVALMHEKPDAVAEQFGTTRNNVDQIKNRMIGKLAELAKAMAKAKGISAS